jgi:hypothetical protein
VPAPAGDVVTVTRVVDRRDDQGLPDGAFTGGYCAKKWWC